MKNPLSNIKLEPTLKKIGKIGEYVLAIIVALALLYGILRLVVGKNPITKAYTESNKKIETKIDSVMNDQKFLTARMYELERNLIIYQEEDKKTSLEIKNKVDNLAKLNKAYYEKIKNVDKYSPNQLDSFFRDKYKEYYNK